MSSVRSARPAARSSRACGRLLQRPPARDQRVEVELSVHVQVDQQRQVALRIDRAVVGAEDALVGLGQRERVEARGQAARRQAHDHRRPALAERADRLLGRLDLPDRVEHEVELFGQRRRPRATVSVAPSRVATSSFAGSTSQATMRAAFASRAPWTTDSPTPPQPITATWRRPAPARCCAPRRRRSPPRSRRSPRRRAVRRAGSGSRPTRGRQLARRTRTRRGSGGRSRRRGASASAVEQHAAGSDHGRPPARTATAGPRGTAGSARTAAPTTGSRGRRPRGRSTPGPSADTTPAPSWPSTTGIGTSHSPRTTCRSEPHTPAAAISTSTSPARGDGQLELADLDGRAGPPSTAARVTRTAAGRRSPAPARRRSGPRPGRTRRRCAPGRCAAGRTSPRAYPPRAQTSRRRTSCRARRA